MASGRKKRNNIFRLSKTDNTFTTDQKEMENIVIDFYVNLFTTQNPTQEDIHKVTRLLSLAVIQEINTSLDLPLSKEEIKKALFNLNPSKAPSPDGFTALFFQDA